MNIFLFFRWMGFLKNILKEHFSRCHQNILVLCEGTLKATEKAKRESQHRKLMVKEGVGAQGDIVPLHVCGKCPVSTLK